jgi:hypothetical protein
MRAASMIALFPVLAITPDIPAGEAQADGWRPLFDGKSLDGWEHVGPGKMVVADGLLRTEGGMGLRWYHPGDVRQLHDPARLQDDEQEVEFRRLLKGFPGVPAVETNSPAGSVATGTPVSRRRR